MPGGWSHKFLSRFMEVIKFLEGSKRCVEVIIFLSRFLSSSWRFSLLLNRFLFVPQRLFGAPTGSGSSHTAFFGRCLCQLYSNCMASGGSSVTCRFLVHSSLIKVLVKLKSLFLQGFRIKVAVPIKTSCHQGHRGQQVLQRGEILKVSDLLKLPGNQMVGVDCG